MTIFDKQTTKNKHVLLAEAQHRRVHGALGLGVQ